MKIKTGIKAGAGLGDAVEELSRITGIDRLVELYEQTSGQSCGCDQRKESLNQIQIPFIR
jgi:hypothetical protein